MYHLFGNALWYRKLTYSFEIVSKTFLKIKLLKEKAKLLCPVEFVPPSFVLNNNIIQYCVVITKLPVGPSLLDLEAFIGHVNSSHNPEIQKM